MPLYRPTLVKRHFLSKLFYQFLDLNARTNSERTGAGNKNLQRFKGWKSAQVIELAVGSRYNVGVWKDILQ